MVRRNFIKAGVLTGLGVSLGTSAMAKHLISDVPEGKRIGIIGLDTSHSIAFTKIFNAPDAGESLFGFRVVAAYPKGTTSIQRFAVNIEGYTNQMREMGIEITPSIEELLKKVDSVLLVTNDGRLHFEQALQVLRAGKRMFIDKPLAASLSDGMAIFNAARHYGIPVFSSSSLRYIQGMDEVKAGAAGKILGADTYCRAAFLENHPDLFWYGIHGVEILFTAMGNGCKTVSRAFTPGADVVVGIWEDDRIGTFRGIRTGRADFGGRIFGEKEIRSLGSSQGYSPLMKATAKYFHTGILPVQPEETLEILAFMEAADESKKLGGKPVSMDKLMDKARVKSRSKKL